ncbi:hypothetical protein I9H08_04430 [Pseudomonas syringae pv. syringae]|nr:hypothetical protein [Pseudomonas sp. P135]UQB21089.1 hypothetical protein I9H08_04430 [Pseudomonas syringae pv. syringae]
MAMAMGHIGDQLCVSADRLAVLLIDDLKPGGWSQFIEQGIQVLDNIDIGLLVPAAIL